MTDHRKPVHRLRERADIRRTIFEYEGPPFDDESIEYVKYTHDQRQILLAGQHPTLMYKFELPEYFDAVSRLGPLTPDEVSVHQWTIQKLIAKRRSAELRSDDASEVEDDHYGAARHEDPVWINEYALS